MLFDNGGLHPNRHSPDLTSFRGDFLVGQATKPEARNPLIYAASYAKCYDDGHPDYTAKEISQLSRHARRQDGHSGSWFAHRHDRRAMQRPKGPRKMEKPEPKRCTNRAH